MDTLRLWLLFVGLLFIAGVYGWGKFQEKRAARKDSLDLVGGAAEADGDDDWNLSLRAERRRIAEAELDDVNIPVLDDVVSRPSSTLLKPEPRVGKPQPPPEKRQAPAPARPSAPPPKPQPAPEKPVRELLVVLGVRAPSGREFSGADLVPVFAKAGLYYGDMHIFHAPVDLERPDGPVLFSVANMVEPGTLEPDKLRLLSTPGLFLFTRLPGRVNGLETFEHMQATAGFLARELGGEVCDERRQSLTQEKNTAIRERILSTIGDAVVVPEE